MQLGLGDVEAERRVSETHRLVVESLLELNTFNAQLSAVREINQMLTNVKGAESGLSSGEAADVAGDAMRWIDAKNFYGADLPLGRRRTQRQVRHVPCRMNPNASSPETRRPFVFLVHF